MKAVILAAGIASRLRPLTGDTPKCVLKAADKNIIELTINNIIANDINEVIIVSGYLAEQIKMFVSNEYPLLNVTYIYNKVYGSQNNIYSLWLTKNSVSAGKVLLMDSDIIFDTRVITKLPGAGYDNCLALKKHEVPDEEIRAKAHNNGRVVEIGKEVKTKEAMGESIGIEKFGAGTLSKLFDILNHKVLVEKNVSQFYEAAFQDLINDGADIFIVGTTDDICMEIDAVSNLAAATKMLLN